MESAQVNQGFIQISFVQSPSLEVFNLLLGSLFPCFGPHGEKLWGFFFSYIELGTVLFQFMPIVFFHCQHEESGSIFLVATL